MNKLNLLISCIVLATSFMTAQNKLIHENRIWEYLNSKGTERWIEQYRFDGTEERYGKEYNRWKLIKKITWSTDLPSAPIEIELDSVAALLREDEDKVYMLLDGLVVRTYDAVNHIVTKPLMSCSGEEGVLYDFNATPGDSVQEALTLRWAEELPWLSPTVLTDCVINSIDPFNLNTGMVNKYTLESQVHVDIIENLIELNPDIDRDNMIEEEFILKEFDGDIEVPKEHSEISYAETVGNIGRGNLTSLMPEYVIFLTSGMMDYETSTLSSVYDTDGTIIYGEPSVVYTVESESSMSDGKIYDLHGREVPTPVSGSIYIRDGKKFVAE